MEQPKGISLLTSFCCFSSQRATPKHPRSVQYNHMHYACVAYEMQPKDAESGLSGPSVDYIMSYSPTITTAQDGTSQTARWLCLVQHGTRSLFGGGSSHASRSEPAAVFGQIVRIPNARLCKIQRLHCATGQCRSA